MKLIASRAVPPNVKLDVELARRQADTQLRSVYMLHAHVMHTCGFAKKINRLHVLQLCFCVSIAPIYGFAHVQ